MSVESVGSSAAAQARVKSPAPPVEEERRSREAAPESRPRPAVRSDGLGARVDERA